MFNVSKKTLSVVLCLALLLSVVAVCFMTPATAKTITSTEEFITYKDLSKEFTPEVNLTFEGDAPYGIPYGRYSNDYFNGYKNGAVEIKSGGHWVFIGKDGTVGKNFLSFQGSTNDNHKTAVANLYTFEVGKTYMVSFDVKSLKGSTVKANGQGNIKYGMAADPSAASAKQPSETGTLMSDYKSNGFALEYKVNGVAQEVGTVLEVDSDWQTATAVFKVKAAGKFGIYVNIGDTVQIDNVKIYNLNNIWSSGENFQNKITFDLGGWGNDRDGSLHAGYATEENGNKYGTIDKSEGGALFPSSGEYGSFISVLYNKHTSEQGIADIASMQSRLFKFEPGKSYEVTFKYRYPTTGHQSGCEPVIGKTNIGVRLMADPGGAAHAADDILANSNSWVKNLKTDGLVLKVDPASGLWQECKVSFTVKTQDEVANYAKVRAGTATEFDFNGGYFCIRSDYRVIHIDDYEVKEFDAEKSSSVSITTDYVYHDMENDAIFNNSNTTNYEDDFVRNNNKGASIIDSEDSKYGKVIAFDDAGSRGAFGDSNVFVKGKKYYISFDAKSTSGAAQTMWLSLSMVRQGNNYDGSQNPATRVIFRDHSALKTILGLYINGVKINNLDNFKVSTEWQHFGIVLDFTDEAVVSAFENANSAIFNEPRYFHFGVANSWYDNFSIVSTSDVAGAVPETDGADITTPSTIYFNDMSNVTASNITNNTADTTSVGTDESDPTRGNVIKFSSKGTRSTIKDTNVITCGSKYTISFEAKLDTTDATATKNIWMGITEYNSQHSGRYIINDNSTGCTNKDLLGAFKFYVQDLETGAITEKTSTTLKVDNTWKRYIIEFDFTDAKFLAAIAKANATGKSDTQMYKLDEKISYFFFGCADGWFDNLKIVKHVPGTAVEVSIRKPSGTGDDYASAGLRFKTAVDNSVVKNAAEIGFVVAPSTNAARTDGWWELESGLNPIARKGVVKVGVNQDGWYYAKDTSHTYYQMVITGLSMEGGITAYNRRFSAVLYVKNTDGSYDYYALGEASYYQVLGITETLKAQ